MKERTALWDNIKFILIMLVVVGHMAELYMSESDIYKSVFMFIYSFHMPLFFFISGLFHKDKDIGKKCLYFICTGLALKIVLSITNGLRTGVMQFSLLKDGGLPWFMFVTAFFTFFCYVLRNQNKKLVLIFAILTACFAGYDTSLGDYLYIARTVVFFPFYLCGNLVDSKCIESWRKKNRWAIVPAIMIILVWVYLCFVKLDQIYVLKRLFSGRNPYGEVFAAYGIMMRMLCYVLAILIGLAIIILMPDRRIPVISKAGKNTIQVYFWHWPLVRLLNYAGLPAIISMGAAGKACYLFCGVVITIALSFNGVFSIPIRQIKEAVYK